LRRARFALATGLLMATAIPGALASGLAPAAASTASTARTASTATTDSTAAAGTAGRTAQSGGYPVGISITSMTPGWAKPGDIITVSGTVTNISKTTFSHLAVRLDFGSVAVSSLRQLLTDIGSPSFQLASAPAPGRMSQPASVLQPGQTSHWSISFPAAKAGMTTFGVYPLTAVLDSSLGTQLGTANTFLPYVPAAKGRYAKSVPARQRIAWLWPLMDVPLTPASGRPVCTDPQSRALEASLAAGGRLNGLLSLGAHYTSADKLTWAIDPALLQDASDVAGCAGPAQAAAATSWLSQLKKAVKGQQTIISPYGDVSLALIREYRGGDVDNAFKLGQQIARSLLPHDVSAASTSTAWPPDNVSVPILSHLIEADSVDTVVIPNNSVTGAPANVFTTQADTQSSLKVLLSANSLTQLLAAASGKPQLSFSTAQEFLAETALMAGHGPANPIVVAPPQHPLSWQPSASLVQALMTDSSSAPWLTPASIGSLASTATKADPQPELRSSRDSGSFSPLVLHQIGAVVGGLTEIYAIEAGTQSPWTQSAEALAALESSNWPARGQQLRIAKLKKLAGDLSSEQNQIAITVTSRVTLGGLKGNVPVVISNKLNYPVRVRLVVLPIAQPPGGGVTVEQKVKGAILVDARSQVTTTLHVQATQVGSTKITLQLAIGHLLLPGSQSVVVQATQFGTFAMIILAAALGVFMIASAARALRRDRQTPPDSPGDRGHLGSDENEGSQQPPEPDTVIPEPSELGAAGTSGL
jgi:hypothetical protein